MVEKTLIAGVEALPEDSLTRADTYSPAIKKRKTLEPDTTLTKPAAPPVSSEQRKKLDEQIESLYNRVAKELNSNPKDVSFALQKLRIAQSIVIEDIRQYEQALYWVAVVKEMLVQKRNLRRWAYTWGLFVFFYGLFWLPAFIAGLFIDIPEFVVGAKEAWFSGLAGGIGGAVAILQNISWQVSVRQAFDRRHTMKYLVQPIMGFLLGIVIFFIVGAGYLIIGAHNFDPNNIGDRTRFIVVQMLLGFIAGFHQTVIYHLIDRIAQLLTPKTAK